MARSLRDVHGQEGRLSKNIHGISENEVIAAYNSVKGKSSEEIEEELFRVAAREMQDGTFDPGQMDDFLKAVSPMLTAAQRTRMESLITRIKGQRQE